MCGVTTVSAIGRTLMEQSWAISGWEVSPFSLPFHNEIVWKNGTVIMCETYEASSLLSQSHGSVLTSKFRGSMWQLSLCTTSLCCESLQLTHSKV